jgi:hypothetical protein
MDELFAGDSREERPDDIGISHVGQLGALPKEAPNVLTESFIWLLVAAPEVLGVARADIGTLKIFHKNLYEVGPVVDVSGRKMLQLGSC